jgi:hypothetical protein
MIRTGFSQATIHDGAFGRAVDACAALPRIVVLPAIAVMALRPN